MHGALIAVAVALALWLGIGPCMPGLAAAGEGRLARIVVSLGSDAAPYRAVERGFRKALAGRSDLPVMQEGEGAASAPFDGETLHLCVGPEALARVVEGGHGRIVAALVLDEGELRPRTRVTGVHLRHDLHAQLRLIARLFPQRKRLAILHGPGRNETVARQAQELARPMGLAVLEHRVSSMRDLSRVLSRVNRDADLLWGLPDSQVYNANTARSILQFSLRSRIPFVAPSSTWVKAGAVVGLGWDFEDMGRQCADLARRVLAVPEGDLLPVGEAPRKLIWDMNESSARYLRIDLPRPGVAGEGLRKRGVDR